MKKIETRAYSNIALIKYWGKKDSYYNLCNQSSISFTTDLYYTDAVVSENDKDLLIINDQIANDFEQEKIIKWLNKIRSIYKIEKYFKIITYSKNPISVGFASSASAYAAMALGVAYFINPLMTKEEISKIARIGSGSASRSVFSGFSTWIKGDTHDSSFAKAILIDWEEFRIIYIPISDKIKLVSSTKAMAKAVLLDEYQDFVRNSNEDYQKMMIAIKNKDINSVGKISESNSNRMHKLINLSGINYYDKTTYEVIEKVKKIRVEANIPVYYTIDAGANVKLITLSNYVYEIVERLNEYELKIASKGSEAYFK